MKKEKALIEYKENKIKKVLDSIKSFFGNLFKKNKSLEEVTIKVNNIDNKNNSEKIKENDNVSDDIKVLEDMEMLSKVVNGEIKSSSLEPDVQERLISLCRKRRMQIRENIKETDEKIARINQLLKEIEEIKNM